MATSRQTTQGLEYRGLRRFRVLLSLLGLATVGCVGQGLLYTKVISPYSSDFHNTPTGGSTCRVDEHILREPFSHAGVSASFTSRVVEEAARKSGMTNLYYADIETLSILNGLYERKTLIICGD